MGQFDIDDALDPKGWKLLGATTKKLWLNKDIVSPSGGRRLRLEGQAIPGQLTLDADTTEVDQDFLVQQTMALLHQARVRAKNDTHDIQMQLAQAQAERARVKLSVMPRGQRV